MYPILPGQKVATVDTHQLLEVQELSQQEVFTIQNCHPVYVIYTKLRRIVWNYTLTNLYAEIGSYVGLFLGVAIVHCTALADLLYSWILDTSAIRVTQ